MSDEYQGQDDSQHFDEDLENKRVENMFRQRAKKLAQHSPQINDSPHIDWSRELHAVHFRTGEVREIIVGKRINWRHETSSIAINGYSYPVELAGGIKDYAHEIYGYLMLNRDWYIRMKVRDWHATKVRMAEGRQGRWPLDSKGNILKQGDLVRCETPLGKILEGRVAFTSADVAVIDGGDWDAEFLSSQLTKRRVDDASPNPGPQSRYFSCL